MNKILTDGQAMAFRQATADDLQQAWLIIRKAKRFMHEKGRYQWTEEYPSLERIEADILSGGAYVMCDGGGRIGAYAYVTAAPEPAYAAPSARWLSHGPYVVIHRLAVGAAFRGRGLGRAMLLKAEHVALSRGIGSIKVDTNHDNAEMLGLLNSLGYTHCGTVSYGFRGERMAFEKLINT